MLNIEKKGQNWRMCEKKQYRCFYGYSDINGEFECFDTVLIDKIRSEGVEVVTIGRSPDEWTVDNVIKTIGSCSVCIFNITPDTDRSDLTLKTNPLVLFELACAKSMNKRWNLVLNRTRYPRYSEHVPSDWSTAIVSYEHYSRNFYKFVLSIKSISPRVLANSLYWWTHFRSCLTFENR